VRWAKNEEEQLTRVESLWGPLCLPGTVYAKETSMKTLWALWVTLGILTTLPANVVTLFGCLPLSSGPVVALVSPTELYLRFAGTAQANGALPDATFTTTNSS
jgi:hypothetical protein